MAMRWVLAALLCGAAVSAQERPPAPKPPAPREAARPPLSREDAEVVKDLALLERLELLRNLELFEQDEKPKQTKEERP